MPRARATHRINAQFLDWLADWRDGYETGTNNYYVYSKAFKGLKESMKEFSAPRELLEVKGIGKGIVAKLEKRYAQENGEPVSAPDVPKPRRRPLKRTAADVDMEAPPAAKRRTVGAAALPTQVATTQLARTATATMPAGINAPFKFSYLDGNKRVRDQVDAETSFFEFEDGSQLLKMKVVYPLSQANHPLAAELFGPERRGDTMVAEMPEYVAAPFPQCPGFAEAPEPGSAKRSVLSALLEEDKLLRERSRKTTDPSRQLPAYLQNRSTAIASGSRSTAPSVSISSSSALNPPSRPLPRAVTNAVASSSSASTPQRTTSAPAPLHTQSLPSHVAPVQPQTTFSTFVARVFKGGDYTVRLLLDNREPEAFVQPLRNNGLSVETRALALGDVAWIATNGTEEYVLDVVLERKRLDDLVESTTNGRFHDQKFRLHQSGISCVMYLVEVAYNADRHRAKNKLMIDTALSSTQMVDRFMGAHSRTQDEGSLHHPDREDIPPSYLKLQTHLHQKHPGRCFVTSYADYQALNAKSTTVRDTWTRMLLSVWGMSAEKASAVVARWDTPRALWEAFRAAQVEERRARAEEEEAAAGPSKGKGKTRKSAVPEARLMLEGVGGAEGGVRTIGPALSTKVYRLLMAENYED
ncbi:ERCC4 domain-containing protein [Mycena epipterygia]|nr:ERCC4 domain-containing protein [Mycena epipterygia]